MTSCAEFRAQIDRYADIDASSRANLDAHLRACAACAEYKADADKTMQLLRELTKRLTPTAPVEQAFERLATRLAALRRQTVWGLLLVAACIIAPFAMLLRGPLPPGGFAGMLALAVAAAVTLVWGIKREQSAMLSLTRRASGFYSTWQRDLEKKIRMLTGAGALVAVWSVGFMFYSVLGPFGIVEQLVVLSTAFILAVGALHTFVVELKQLKDELALVRDASRG
jgi:anti-sigma factor RsiW